MDEAYDENPETSDIEMSQLTTIHFHGALGREVGERFELAVENVAEALRAVDSMTGKLFQYLMEKEKGAASYKVLLDERPIEEEVEVHGPMGASEIHVVPQVAGASGVGKILAGIALVAIAIAIPGGQFAAGSLGAFAFGTGAGITLGFVGTLGVSLIIGGVAQLLAPSPEGLDVANDKNDPSTTFQGIRNTTAQGSAVPLGYGELIIGSHLVSIGIENVDAEIDAS